MIKKINKTFLVLLKRLKLLLNQRMMQVIVVLSPLIIIATIILLGIIFNKLPPEVPLYYSRPWGNEQLTSSIYLFLLPLGSLIWYVATLLLVTTQIYQYRVFSQLLFIFSLVVTIFSSLAIINILILVL